MGIDTSEPDSRSRREPESVPDLPPEEAERRAKELAHRLLNTPPKPRPATKRMASKPKLDADHPKGESR